MKAQGLDRSKLPYASNLQPYAAWYAAISCFFICLVRFSTAFLYNGLVWAYLWLSDPYSLVDGPSSWRTIGTLPHSSPITFPLCYSLSCIWVGSWRRGWLLWSRWTWISRLASLRSKPTGKLSFLFINMIRRWNLFLLVTTNRPQRTNLKRSGLGWWAHFWYIPRRHDDNHRN